MLVRSLLAVVVPVVSIIATNANALPQQFHYYHASHHVAAATPYHDRAIRFPHAATPSRAFAGAEGQIVAHPAGCPRTLFCGCGAAQELGLTDSSLWAVKSWYKFPRAAAAAGMALLWGERHVAAIRTVHGDGTATVYAANSGGGLTRVHRISLAGLIVVDPHAGHRGEPTFASFSRTAPEQPAAQRVAAKTAGATAVSYDAATIVARFAARVHPVIPPSPDSCTVADLYRPLYRRLATSMTAAAMEKHL
jgi:hypothetical protein